MAIGRLGDHHSWFYLLANRTGEDFYYGLNGTLQGGPSDASIYVTALYYMVTSLTTVGFGNIAANTVREKAFTVCVMIIGGKRIAVSWSVVSIQWNNGLWFDNW